MANISKAPFEIRRWCSYIRGSRRGQRKSGILSQERIALLDALGFQWALSERRLLLPSKIKPREKRPIGTIVVRRQFSNGRDVEERWVKVSDTGPYNKRWMPYARWWWEKNRGPIPPGMRVIRLNGNPNDDTPGNFSLGTATDVMRIAHRLNPAMSAENRIMCRRGTAEFNRRTGKLSRFHNVLRNWWYPVLEDEKLVFNCPFRRRRTLLGYFGAETEGIPDSGHGPSVERAVRQAGIFPVRGIDLVKDPYTAYARIDPEFGIATPDVLWGERLARKMYELEKTRVWQLAKSAAALDLEERE